MSKVHVVYDGRNQDLDFDQVFPADRYQNLTGSERVASGMTPQQVKEALARFFDASIDEFQDHYVEINPNGNITVRPNTTFG